VHDNRVYGLTKGQASPTSEQGFVTKTQPHGAFAESFNPVAVAVVMGASFVARAYAGLPEHLAGLIAQAIKHRGTALVDIFQPCVSFNKVNTFQWYKEHCYELGEDHDPTDHGQALRIALEFGERIPLGVIYKRERPLFEEQFAVLKNGPLARQEVSREGLRQAMQRYV
jgi:2-oxoglutarate ferredoxin oxidoreductase subunit beta